MKNTYCNQCSFLLFLMVWCYKRQYTDKALTLLRKYNVYTSEWSERASFDNFGIFTFLNCYFFQYFVGTSVIVCRYNFVQFVNDMLVGLQTYRKCDMYRKGIIGGGGGGPYGYANGACPFKFHIAAAHTYQNLGWVPPPPPPAGGRVGVFFCMYA